MRQVRETLINIFQGLNLYKFIFLILIAVITKKVLICYILVNVLSLFRFLYVIIFSRKMYTTNPLDCTIIKIVLFISKTSNMYEKADAAVYVLLSYLIIFFFPFSIKSLNISKTILNNILYEVHIEDKKSIKNIIKKSIESEFLIKKYAINVGYICFKKIIVEIDPNL
jgi:hypothetical protein